MDYKLTTTASLLLRFPGGVNALTVYFVLSQHNLYYCVSMQIPFSLDKHAFQQKSVVYRAIS